jgi:hypothetical protein
MTPIVLPIFVPIRMDGTMELRTAPEMPTSQMRCTACDRIQRLDNGRVWNRGVCHSCGGGLVNHAA